MERFVFDSSPQVFRRKTLTAYQKALLYLIWLGVCAGSVFIILTQQADATERQLYFMILLMLPTVLGIAASGYLALNPKGPERDFILPGPEPGDCALIRGQIKTPDDKTLDVEVVVPSVYSTSSDLLGDGMGVSAGSGLAYDEMFDMGLAEVNKKYPGSVWQGVPDVIDS